MKSKTLFLILLTVFALHAPAMLGQTFSVIHTFTGTIAGGAFPFAGVTIRGNTLYGTELGYYNGVYQLSHSGSNWLFSTVAALPDNHALYARVVFGPDGHLYGTSFAGGRYSQGAVFELTSPVGVCKTARCPWTVNNVHDFGSGNDGQGPNYGDLIWDQQGNIYGTTYYGGTFANGTVYELMPSGNGYTESILYSFSGRPDGAIPWAGLVFDNKGNLFGTTAAGGSKDAGTVFELSYVPGVGWMEHVLYSFQYASDGAIPQGGLIFDSHGNLYGTTLVGGNGGGTVFELSPSGDTWAFKLLHSFTDSGRPQESLSLDGAGNLYGTTTYGGIYGFGNIFKLSNTDNGWVYTSLHDFTGGTDGNGPTSYVAIDTDGTLYGIATAGGDPNCWLNPGDGCGVVWKIKP